MSPTFSLVISHTPWRPERVEAIHEMLARLGTQDRPTFINSRDYRGTDWQVSKVAWAWAQWTFAAAQKTTHHVFMTDDLHISPCFWPILSAMVEGSGAESIGLLCNHPRGPRLFSDGDHGYRTNSWLVGPAYVLEHETLVKFLAWFDALPDGPHTTFGTKAYRNDDSSINEFVSTHGLSTWHPLPTIIEHRGDLESTVGHGDEYSRERVSWRRCQIPMTHKGEINWTEIDLHKDLLEKMIEPSYWAAHVQMLPVGGT